MLRTPWLFVFLAACAGASSAGPVAPASQPTAPATPSAALSLPEESHLKDVRALIQGGENAEAYWSFDGRSLSLQRRTDEQGCDRIYTLKVFDDAGPIAQPQPVQLSSGQGATTCAHYFPDGKLLYASTHLGGPQCPPRPDMSQGYVWAIYDSYDIFKANPDGSGIERLTDTPGYDAEGTVCGKDGSIVFTSVRDGDIELYRMDKDGKNVKRLTSEPGYDGGAFFNADCSKIVWRASRPKPGPELDSFKGLLAQGLVRPTKLELFVANADGSDARQVTYLNSAAFAPFFIPNRERILFSSNYGDPKGREFDIFAINSDGTDLERITHTPGFDGFPMFSPDGKWLAFSSNRFTAEGSTDTNLYLARWDDHAPQPLAAGPAERLSADTAWLADPAREGRGVGTAGLAAAGAWLETRFREIGLAPLGADGSYRVPFEVTTAIKSGAGSALKVAGRDVPRDQFTPLGGSAQGSVKGQAVLAGYGIRDQELGLDDFKRVNVQGKIVVARRFAPENEKLQEPQTLRRAGDLRKKAFVAKSLGARALVVVDWPEEPKPAGAVAAGPAKLEAASAGAKTAPGGVASAAAPSASPSTSTSTTTSAAPSASTSPSPSTTTSAAPSSPSPSPSPSTTTSAAPSASTSTSTATTVLAARGGGADPHAGMAAPVGRPAEAPLPDLTPEGPGDAGIPILVVTRAALEPVWKQLVARQRVDLELAVALETERTPAFNLVGRIPAGQQPSQGAVIIGAHYDHLGYGGHGSLAPDKHEPHLGADDNASGTATLLEIARTLSEQRASLSRDVIIAAFSGEELGVLGSSSLVASKPAWLSGATAMLNLDMVGRLRSNTLDVLGSDSAREWPDVVRAACEQQRVQCRMSGDGYGPSDHMPFYAQGLPVLHFFTGAHSDYHKPSDRAALLNSGGMAHVAGIVAEVARSAPKTLTYQKTQAPAGRGDARSFNASLGTIPDYAGPPSGAQGVLLADVRPGGGAEKAGMKRGDVLVKLGKFEVRSVEDLMFVLMQAKPGETVTSVVLRDGKPVTLETTYQEGRRR